MKITIENYEISLRKSLRIKCESILSNAFQYIPRDESARSFHAFCIGLPRSGTHSIAGIFSDYYKSYHEPKAHNTIVHLLQYLNNQVSDKEFRTTLLARDKLINCEMESSHYLHHVADILVDIFPNSKFIFTVRDPLSWLISEINQNQLALNNPIWNAIAHYRYAQYGYDFTDEDRCLESIPKTYPVASYLSYWSDHITKVVKSVPAERLLVLNTFDIRNSSETLANFLSIDKTTINTNRSHAAQITNKTYKIYEHIEKNYVNEKIEKHCSEAAKLLDFKIII